MKRLLIVLIIFLQNGCATVASNIEMSQEGQIHFPSEYEAYNHCIKSRVYSGTRTHWAIQNPSPNPGGNVFGIFLLPDMALSLAADTILLPYTIPENFVEGRNDNCS